jgi:hypothetical protein
MSHLFVILTTVTYVLSLGAYAAFLTSGKEIAGRAATALFAAGL